MRLDHDARAHDARAALAHSLYCIQPQSADRLTYEGTTVVGTTAVAYRPKNPEKAGWAVLWPVRAAAASTSRGHQYVRFLSMVGRAMARSVASASLVLDEEVHARYTVVPCHLPYM